MILHSPGIGLERDGSLSCSIILWSHPNPFLDLIYFLYFFQTTNSLRQCNIEILISKWIITVWYTVIEIFYIIKSKRIIYSCLYKNIQRKDYWVTIPQLAYVLTWYDVVPVVVLLNFPIFSSICSKNRIPEYYFKDDTSSPQSLYHIYNYSRCASSRWKISTFSASQRINVSTVTFYFNLLLIMFQICIHCNHKIITGEKSMSHIHNFWKMFYAANIISLLILSRPSFFLINYRFGGEFE